MMYFPLILFLEIVILTGFFQKDSSWGRYSVCEISGQIVKFWQSYKQQKSYFIMELLGNFNRWCHQSNLQHIQKVLKILWLFWKSLTIFFPSPRNSSVQIFWICCVYEYSKWLLNTTKCITGSVSFIKEEGQGCLTGISRWGTVQVQICIFTRLSTSFALWQTFP